MSGKSQGILMLLISGNHVCVVNVIKRYIGAFRIDHRDCASQPIRSMTLLIMLYLQ